MVNAYTTGQQTEPSVAADGAGNFVVVWEDESARDGSGSGVFGQRLDGTGSPLGTDFQVNTYTTFDQSYPVVAANGEGSFMVFWWDDDCFECVDGRFFDATGTPQAGQLRIDGDGGGLAEGPPLAATADAAGNFLVVWPSDHYGGAKSVFGQHLDPSGTPSGSIFQVTHIDDIYQYHVDVAPLAGGDFVVTWDWSPFSSHYNVFGRVVDGLGACPPAPTPGCHTAALPGRATLTLKDRSPDKGDSLLWKWVRGDEVQLADLGSPTTSDAYVLCLYEATGKLLDVTVPAAGTCGVNPCWRDLGAAGFKYVNKSGGAVRKLVLAPGAAGESRVIVKAKGTTLVTPALPLVPPLEARLLGPAGECWATTFAPGDVTLNSVSDVKAKGGS
jgi:hypothetical protein